MIIKPFGDQILIKKYELKVEKPSIIIPGVEDTVYEVLDVGPGLTNQYGVTLYPIPKVGDLIILSNNWAECTTINGVEYLFCENKDIQAYIVLE